MKKEDKNIEQPKEPNEPKVLTGQNVENGLNYKDMPVINEQIKPSGTAILG